MKSYFTTRPTGSLNLKIPLNTYPVIRNKSVTNTNTNMLCKFVAVYAMKACRGVRSEAPLILDHTLSSKAAQ